MRIRWPERDSEAFDGVRPRKECRNMKRRINIGLVIDDIDNYFSNQAAIGAEQAAKVLDANLFVFPGHYIGKTDSRYADKKYEYQYNSIFNLPTERNVDIIYILQGLICSRADLDVQTRFLKMMPEVPIVCLFSDFEGYHSVTFDNRSGLRGLLKHLIEKHKARDIGFVSGPITNRDARERLDIYKEILKEYDIPFDPYKISYGDFSMASESVVEELLDNNEHLDAVVFANDSMAVGGYAAFKKRGLVPGKDILVGGFDDDIFAISLEPPLTTVEASSASLAYKAVLNAENYINGIALKDMTVETHLVQRNSCGCDDFDADVMCERLKLTDDGIDIHELFNEVEDYLFNDFVDSESISEPLEGFLNAYLEMIKADDKSKPIEEMNEQFSRLLRTDLFVLSSREKCFNILQTLQNRAMLSVNDDERLLINETFSKYFRRLAFSGILPANSARRRTERMQGVINRQVGDVFLIENKSEIPYEHLLGSLNGIGYKRSLLYLFQGKVKHHGTFDWMPPASILLKAICDDNGLRTLPDEQQLLRTENIFENEYITGDERRTMLVSPLFVGADLYGLLVNELEITNSYSVSSIATQLSVTLRSLFMIEEQNKVRQSLQISLERFIRDNTKLEEIAQKDELTGLYNRRGFISNAERVLEEPSNQGKVAIICYADLDNLKTINDKFGHDDGDYALKTISQVLQESFRDTDIIGRIGGDEFLSLAITGSDCDVDSMKARLEKVTRRYNKFADKPYTIEMSTGIYKFKIIGKVDIYEMMNNADQLLYQEKIRKKTGRTTQQ